jgi:hypothetical protein
MLTLQTTRFTVRTVPVVRRMMVLTLTIVCHGVMTAPLHAQRLDWKLEDFKPLTELPWSEDLREPLPQVLTAIFHEPELAVRMQLLDEYLQAIPAAQLGPALDLCLELEGTQNPDDLVEYFIALWAKRDPAACWARMKELLKVTGMEDGWLNYDGWSSRSRIAVQNREALKASRHWLRSQAFSSFTVGLEQASLTRAERTMYLKEFADIWITTFGEMPSPGRNPYAPEPTTVALSYIFSGSPQSRYGYIFSGGNACTAEMAARRYIKAFPDQAPELIARLKSEKKPETNPYKMSLPDRPSRALFQLWAEADLSGMTRWADSEDKDKNQDAVDKDWGTEAKGMLMSRVDAGTREQWLSQARKTQKLHDLLISWAMNDPKAALQQALKTKDDEIIEQVVRKVAYGPQGGRPFNTSHPGLGMIRDFDFSVLPYETYALVVGEGAITIMEQWGEVDAGEAARFGLQHVFKLSPSERQEILAFLQGQNNSFADTADVLDRTFCALRVWAVTKPDEMKAWIGTLKEEDLRTALTWLLENPWGTEPEE